MEELGSLVTAAMAGDLNAYGQIVRRFQDMAYGYSYSALGDFQLAEDAAQEAFVEAHQKLSELREPKAFPGWFRRIVVKQCDRIRRRRREMVVDDIDAHPATGPEPDEVLERKELRERVLEAIRGLPENQRTVTTLFYLNGYSQQEVSEFLEVPLTTVKKRLHDARARLKERMLEMVGETLKSFPLHERFADVVAQLTFVRERISPLQDSMRRLTDAQMRAKSDELRARLARGEDRDGIKAEAFALVREATRRATGYFHYDIQMVTALMLDEGWVAEAAAGEGKTLCCYPAVFMAALEGRHVHVVTPNGYLATRDSKEAGRVLSMLGVEVGFLGGPASALVDLPPCGHTVTYGTATDFAFHYLNRHALIPTQPGADRCCDFAIIDEIDSVLIDNSLTPVIVSDGTVAVDETACKLADTIARALIGRTEASGSAAHSLYTTPAGSPYDIELTDEGRATCVALAGPTAQSVQDVQHRVRLALRANLHYVKNKDYVVESDRVVIIDADTARANPSRRLSDGLHQAIEAKEGLPITADPRAKATIFFYEYFKQYRKLAGLTGTAMPQSDEFREQFGLKVARVPTRKALNRVDYHDRLYRDDEARWEGVAEEVHHQCRDLRRPVLVGASSSMLCDRIADILKCRWGIDARILDARPENMAAEAQIVEQTGMQRTRDDGSGLAEGVVTIATAMGGRGTDVRLGPDTVSANCRVPASAAGTQEPNHSAGAAKCCIYCDEYDEKAQCAQCYKPALDPAFPKRGRTLCRREVPCGLHVIGVGHGNQRQDEQLRRRAARQGEPGSSRFHASLQDELVKRSVDKSKVGALLGSGDKVVVEGARVSRALQRLQREAEVKNAGIRAQAKAHRANR
jgi:preprotein translocase subunit SecA